MSIIVSVIAAAVAVYADIVSTLSLRLATRAHRAGGPIVTLGWRYFSTKQELTLIVTNTGRADVTVSSFELAIIRDKIIRRFGNAFDSVTTVIEDEIPQEQWLADLEVSLPMRLLSNSSFSVKVSREGIPPLPPEYPFNELLLEFSAITPDGGPIVYFRGNLLRHLLASDPDWEAVPDGGALPGRY